MEEVLVQKERFLEIYPSKKSVIKHTSDETVRFKCRIDPELHNHKDLLIEVWTDLTGRYHGHEMKTVGEEYVLEMPCKHTGFFKATFRWRHKDHEYWNWVAEPSEEEFAEIHVDPAYINKSIVYNAFIRFFGQKEIKEKGAVKYGSSGTFDDLKRHLDHIKKLGVDILYLNPIHPIGELYRNYNPHDQYPSYLQPGCPYSIKDYKSIDPELAVDRDHSEGPHASLSDPMIEFKEMVDEAHKRGIKVYMDLVFNHTSHDFILQRLHPEWFLYKENIKSLEEPFIYPEEIKNGKPWGDPKHTFCPFDHGYWWEDAAQLNWEQMIPDASNKPPKNPTLHEMYAYFKSIPQYWIKHIGIDGFRCDVAYRVPTKFWRECIHEAREIARKEHPHNGSLTGDVVFIAESYCDDIDELLRAGFTAAYGDYSNKLYNPLTLKGYLEYMYNISGHYFPEHSKFFIFPECHDFHRNTQKILGHLSTNEVLSERANKSRWAITAMLPGIPMIFNGFEKMEWQPINLFSYSKIDWEADKDLKQFITKVNNIRNTQKALQKGIYTFIETNQGVTDHTQVFAFSRRFDKEQILVCVNMDVHNKACAKVFIDKGLELNFDKKYTLNDLLNRKKYVREGKELLVVLEPGESHIFLITQ